MELYKAHKRAGSLFAMCCTMAGETYHHWRVFTAGMEGVCIEFNREHLEASLRQLPQIEARPIEYLMVSDLKNLISPTDADRLAFIKRDGFSDEAEWRIISSSSEIGLQTFEVPLDMGSIKRIFLSPWMPPKLVINVRKIIKSIAGCENLSVESSELTNSVQWMAAGGKLVLQPSSEI